MDACSSASNPPGSPWREARSDDANAPSQSLPLASVSKTSSSVKHGARAVHRGHYALPHQRSYAPRDRQHVIQSSWDVFNYVRASRASTRALLALVLVIFTSISLVVSSVFYFVLGLWTRDEDSATLTAKGVTTLVLVYMSTRLRNYTATTTAQGDRPSVLPAIVKALKATWRYINTSDNSPASVDEAPPAPPEPAAAPDSPVAKQPPDTPTTVSTSAAPASPSSSSSSSPVGKPSDDTTPTTPSTAASSSPSSSPPSPSSSPPPSPPLLLDAAVNGMGLPNAGSREVVEQCLGGVIAEVERRVPSDDTLTTPSTSSPSSSSLSSSAPSSPPPPSLSSTNVNGMGLPNAGIREVVAHCLGGVIAEVERRVPSADTLTTPSTSSPSSSSPSSPSSSPQGPPLDATVSGMELPKAYARSMVEDLLSRSLLAEVERRANNGLLQDRDGTSAVSLTPETKVSENRESVVVAPPAPPESSSPVGNPSENTTPTTTSTSSPSPPPPSPLEDATASETGVMPKASIRRVLEAHVKELAAKVALRAPVMQGTKGSSPVSFTPETKVAEVDPSDPLPSPLSMSPPASSPPQSPSDDIGRWMKESILDPIIDNAAWIGEVVATPTDGSVATEAVPVEDASQKATDAQLHLDITSSSSSSSLPSSKPPRRAQSPVHVTPSPQRSSEGIVRALHDLDITPDGPHADDTIMSEDDVQRDENTQTPATNPSSSSPSLTSPQSRHSDDMHTPTSEGDGARAVRLLDMDFVAENDASENTTPVPDDNHDTTSRRPSRIFEPAPAAAGTPLNASVCRPKPAAQARHRYTPTYDANNMRVNRASCLLHANTLKKLNKAVSESGGATPSTNKKKMKVAPRTPEPTTARTRTPPTAQPPANLRSHVEAPPAAAAPTNNPPAASAAAAAAAGVAAAAAVDDASVGDVSTPHAPSSSLSPLWTAARSPSTPVAVPTKIERAVIDRAPQGFLPCLKGHKLTLLQGVVRGRQQAPHRTRRGGRAGQRGNQGHKCAQAPRQAHQAGPTPALGQGRSHVPHGRQEGRAGRRGHVALHGGGDLRPPP